MMDFWHFSYTKSLQIFIVTEYLALLVLCIDIIIKYSKGWRIPNNVMTVHLITEMATK